MVLSFFLLVPVLAHAHIGAGPTSGFSAGLNHPLGGLDHILAMIAVGIWAAQVGGRALWAAPSVFVVMMLVGGALGLSGAHVPFVEQGIILSVLTLGVFIAAAVRMPLLASMLIVGMFAVFHGHSHGTEIPSMAPGFAYGAGFAFATASLHLAGIGFVVMIQKKISVQVVRFAGVTITVGGLFLLF
jgi:urease accessory protein